MDQKIEAEAERKSKVQAQERDFAPTERELLLEAATKRKAAPELKEYSKKAHKREELQGKLEKQQAQLRKLAAAFDVDEMACVITSAQTGLGIDTLKRFIEQAC